MDEIIQAVAELLYSAGAPAAQITIAEVLARLAEFDGGQVEVAIQYLSRNGLLRQPLQHPEMVAVTADGKIAYDRRCCREICLGERYIATKYGTSVVHIVVQKPNGDEAGGTGFFVEDFPGHIATARHVVEGNRIVEIIDRQGAALPFREGRVSFVADGEDVALVECPIGVTMIPLRIEWDATQVRELDQVLALGYPPIARHQPALVHASGSIAALPMRQTGNTRSLMISRITEPGHSGGPVINNSGYVVGIVEQENQLQRHDGGNSVFVTAAFALHLRDIPL